MLMTLLESKKAGDWGAVEEDLDRAAKAFLGLDRGAVCRLEAAVLKRRLVDTGPTHEYKVRAQVLCRILVESAEAAAGRGEGERARGLFLKALHLLLDTLLGSGFALTKGTFSRMFLSTYVQTARRRLFVGDGFSPLSACSRLFFSRYCGNDGGGLTRFEDGRQAYVLE